MPPQSLFLWHILVPLSSVYLTKFTHLLIISSFLTLSLLAFLQFSDSHIHFKVSEDRSRNIILFY